MHHNPQPHGRPWWLGLALFGGALLLIPIIGGGWWLWLQWQAFILVYPLAADLMRFILFAAPVSLGVGYGSCRTRSAASSNSTSAR